MRKLSFEEINFSDRVVAEVNGDPVFLNTEKCCERCGPQCRRRKCCAQCVHCESIETFETYEDLRSKVFPVPLDNGDGEMGFCFAANGAGKSVWASNYAQMYTKVFPENPIYIVSFKEEDEVLDKLPNTVRVPFQDILDDAFDENSIENCLCIFDDVDSEPGRSDSYDAKELFKKTETIRDALLTRGRSKGISVLVTSHLALNFKHTRVPINESKYIVCFPNSGNFHQIQVILQKYSGLSLEQIRKIKDLKTRWVYVYKSYPQYVVYEHGIYLL